MSDRDAFLRRIANTLAVYVYHVKDNGLVYGKSGIMLFLYEYAAQTDSQLYYDFAGDLLDGLVKTVGTMPHDFEHGLSGFGWAMGRLFAGGVLDGNADAVLRPVDCQLFGGLSDEGREGVFGRGLYALLRAGTGIGANWSDVMGRLFVSIKKEVDKEQRNVGLYRLCSMLHFVQEVEPGLAGSGNKAMAAYLRKRLRGLVEDAVCGAAHDDVGAVVARAVLGNAGMDVAGTEGLASPSVENFIRTAWRQLVFFGKVSVACPAADAIENFINAKQQSLTMPDFTVDVGLAGLGLALMKI